MTECKSCMQLSIDVMFFIGRRDWYKAIESCEELMRVLKTYKESC